MLRNLLFVGALAICSLVLACAKQGGEASPPAAPGTEKQGPAEASPPEQPAVEGTPIQAPVKKEAAASPAAAEEKKMPEKQTAPAGEGIAAPPAATGKAGEADVAGKGESKEVAAAAGTPAAPGGEAAAAGAPAPAPAAALDFPHVAVEEVIKRQKRFIPVPIEWDKSRLSENDKELVRRLVRVARVIDHLYWLQSSAEGLEWRSKLAGRTDPEARALFHYLMVNYGPWDRLDEMAPFLGDKPKPLGAGFYPADLTADELNKWLEANPADGEAFRSNFTVIRRQEGKLVAVPYSKEYERELQAARKLTLAAAEVADNHSLKKFLTSRAEAFLSNDYFQSDVDWLDLDSAVEVTMGPYEVYEDRLFGYKAAFEMLIQVKDPKATQELATYGRWIDRMEKNLPVPDEIKKSTRGKSSPLTVVDVIFTAGDARAGIPSIAYALPNDERVREQKGSKKVLLRNISMAKYTQILRPIAAGVLAGPLYGYLHEDAYFTHSLLHEISHALGPGFITVGGVKTTVGEALKETYPAIEESKADILGLYNAFFLIDKGVLQLAAFKDGKPDPSSLLAPEEAKKAVLTTFLAGIFRSTRFGVGEAHGKGNVMIFNFIGAKGGFYLDETARITFDFDKAVEATREFAAAVLTLEAKGDYEGCKAFMEQYGKISNDMKTLLAGLENLPVDIEPIFDLP